MYYIATLYCTVLHCYIILYCITIYCSILYCYIICTVGFNYGDPHITTLDGRSYTFNGLGEYIMTRITGQFELQARTILTPGNTTNITATIFSAVAMGSHGNNSILKERVQVWKH